MISPKAQINRMYVRMLLEEKQPDFAAMLESVVQELALESAAPQSCPHCAGTASARRLRHGSRRRGAIRQGETLVV